MPRLLPILLLVLVSTSSVVAKDWHGILPLHSTREDVEALLGPAPPPLYSGSYKLHKDRSLYFLNEGEVYIRFADEDFLRESNCQSLLPGTVLMIRVTPKDDMLLASLKLDEKIFRKFDPSKATATGYEGFIDEKEGLVIRAFKGKVQEMVYFASAADRGRCQEFYEHPENFVRTLLACGLRFDEYGDVRFSDEKARLDNFAIQLLNDEKAQGYIIVYGGRKATIAEAQIRANRARNYLISIRKIDPERVKAVDGGYREDLTVSLQIVPVGSEPPSLTPTIEPSQVELLYEKKPSRRNH